CGLVLQALAGHDALDPGSAALPVPDFNATLREGVAGLRIGVVRDYFFDYVDPEIVAAVDAAVEVLRGLGATIEEVELPLARQAAIINAPLIQAEATAYHLPTLRSRWDDYSPGVRLRFLGGIGVTGTMYANAQRA